METLLIYLVCFATQERVQVGYSHVRLPAHGTIHKKTLYGFFGKKDDDFGLDAIPIDTPSKVRSDVYSPHANMEAPGMNFRHQIQDNSIWITNGPDFFYRLKFADLDLYKSKNWEAFFDKYPDSAPHRITTLTLYWKYVKIAEQQLGINWALDGYPTDVLGFGSVPASDNSVKSYILAKKTKEFEIWDSHFRWDEKTKGWKTKLVARFEKIGQWVADLDSSDFQKREKAFEELEKVGDMARSAVEELLAGKPSVEARRRALILLDKLIRGRSKADGLWEDADNYERFPSLFAEDFYFFLRKNDYYFVTESGKLYHAPPGKDGEKSRKMKALWVDAKRPIVAVIEDADRDKVWLFAKDKNPGAKLDLFFEMKETIQTKSFDPKKLPPVNVEGRAKLLLEYLPLISAGSKK